MRLTEMLLASAIAFAAPAAVALAADAPEGWQAFKINDKKKLTAYRLVEEDGKPVLHARAEGSASGLGQPGDVQPDRAADRDLELEDQSTDPRSRQPQGRQRGLAGEDRHGVRR